MNFMLFLPEPGMSWLIVAAVIALIFGGSRLPQLAKALGQSKKAFKDGLAEGEEEAAAQEKARREVANNSKASLSGVDDEELFEEARRRARLRVAEGSIPEDRK